jgi:hypothetical protein
LDSRSKYPVDLRSVLLKGLRAKASHADVTQLVNLFHKAALAYLRTKTSFHLRLTHGLTLEDVALDAIAELFECDNQFLFVKLHRWFNRDRNLEDLEAEELWVDFRRIVFGAVNQHLFRLYRDADPAMARMIRNIKLAIKKQTRLEVVDIDGVSSIRVVERRPGGRSLLPELFPEYLEAEFGSRSSAGMSLTTKLRVVADILQGQEKFRNSLSLISVALLFREHQSAVIVSHEPMQPPDNLALEETRGFVERAVEQVRKGVGRSYLRSSKLDRESLDTYLSAVRDALVSDYSEPEGKQEGLFEYLRRYLPSLTHDQYRKRHRTILEYLTSLGRKKLIADIKKDLRISATK